MWFMYNNIYHVDAKEYYLILPNTLSKEQVIWHEHTELVALEMKDGEGGQTGLRPPMMGGVECE